MYLEKNHRNNHEKNWALPIHRNKIDCCCTFSQVGLAAAPDARFVLADRDSGLTVTDEIDDVLAKHRKPSIWSMFKPTDVYLYDLIYEPYLGPPKRSYGL